MSAKSLAPPPLLLSFAAVLALYEPLWPIACTVAGRVYALIGLGDAAPFAIYAPPSLYLLANTGALPVKLVSLAGALTLAVAVWRLLRTLSVHHARRWAALTLLLPAGALLGQSDALWTAPCLMALDAAIRRRHGTMLLWCGLAFAFNPQAALFAPFIVAVLIQRRINPAPWLLAPASYVGAISLAALLGWTLRDLAWIPPIHAMALPPASLGAPNIWFVVETLLPGVMPQLGGLAIAGAVGAGACYIAHFSTRLPGAGVRLLPVALLASLITAGVSPHLPDGSFLLAGMIALVWAVAAREPHAWRVALLIQAGSTLATAGNLFDQSALVVVAFVAIAVATWLVATPLLRPAANDNEAMMRVWRRLPVPYQPAL